MRKHLMIGILLAPLALAGCGSGSGAPQPGPDNGGREGPAEPGNAGSNGPIIIGLDEQPRALIEAESATCVAPFQVVADAEASGGKYLTIPPKSCDGNVHVHIAEEKDPARTAGSAEIEFEVPEDREYVLWVRKWTCCGCGDSWKMQLDDGKAFTFGNQGTTHRHWSWLSHQDEDGKIKFRLSKGQHKLKLTNRGESGFRIDQILFWADHKRVPQGKEKAAGKDAEGEAEEGAKEAPDAG